MKNLLPLFLSLLLLSCNPSKEQEQSRPQFKGMKESNAVPQATDSSYFDYEKVREQQAKNQLLKKEGLIASEKKNPTLQDLVISKHFYVEDDEYVLDYTYPYLNEKKNPNYKKFNDFMSNNYLNTERTINEILEDSEIICDTLSIPRYRDKRIIDYNLHYAQNDLISILMYKENYYSGMLHSTYMFECINYDSKNQEFIHFKNFFIEGSEKMVLDIINTKITDKMNSGEMFYDCWQMSMDDFVIYRDNFVINEETIAFYFDDCIICPSHTGEYKVVIPQSELAHFIRRSNLSILM